MSAQQRPWVRYLAYAAVATVGGVVVSKVFGPKAGVIGTVAILALHEAFDAPVARLIEDIVSS